MSVSRQSLLHQYLPHPLKFRFLSSLPLIAIFAFAAATLCATAIASVKTATATTLQVNSDCLSEGCVTTLTATVAAGTTSVHPGAVFFCDQTSGDCEYGVTLGKAQIAASGTATLRTTLSVGAHHLYAVFAGTRSFSSSTSANQTLTVVQGAVRATQTALATSYTPNSPLGAYPEAATVTSVGAPAATGTVSDIVQVRLA